MISIIDLATPFQMTTSNITVDLITAGLPDVSPLVRDVLNSRYDADKIRNLALRLGTDVVNYDNYLVAGRLLMYNAIRACSPDIRRYVKALNHRLAPVIKSFLIENADAINAEISERRHLDYTSYDLMGASVLTKGYLLTPAHDEDPVETPQQEHMRLAVQFHHHQGVARVLQAYGEMSRGEYTHASPTHFNAGTLTPQMSSCFIPGTEVCTLNGVKKIEDVVIGDQVVTHTGAIQTVRQLHRNSLGNRKLYDLLCWKTPVVTVTDNHKVYAVNLQNLEPQWVRVDQITTDHYIAIPKKQEWTEDPALDLADVLAKISRGDHVEYVFDLDDTTIKPRSVTTMISGLDGNMVSRCHEHKPINRYLRFNANTAMALGMWYGDGCIRSAKDRKDGIQYPRGISLVCHESNPQLFNFWAESIEELVGVKPAVYKQKNLYHVEVNSTIIGACWKDLFGKGFSGKRLHSSMYDWSPELVRSFMVGLVSTDGCLDTKGLMIIGMTNVELVKQLYHLCRQIGEDVSIIVNKELKKGATALTATLTLPKGWIQPNELLKYYDDDRLEEVHKRSTYYCTKHINDQTFIKVRYIKESKIDRPEYVYTLGIQNDHSYNVEGLVVENCFLEKIDDCLKSILYQGVGDSGMICKLQGGLGINLQLLRHSEIGNSGMSSGVIPFARIYNATIQCVNQGGKRDGAATLFLRIHHIDIEDFIRSTDNFTNHELRLTKANTCIWMSRFFFKRVISKGKWTVFCPSRTKILNDLYGYDFEKAYVKLEVEAEKRDQEYTILKKKVAQLKNELLSDPDDEALGDKYHQALGQKVAAKKALITHRILDAETLYTLIVNNQTRSAMPYIMHGDAVNSKSNQKNLGAIGASNLCLEITEYATPEEMATCNLASLNFKHFVKGEVSWRAAVVSYAELQAVYDFQGMGSSTQSVIENLEQVIEQNYYPLDEHDDVTGELISRGKISLPNLKHRPLGLGGHGLSDAYNETDQAYDSPGAELLNKMIFACMYWNALIKSLELAIRYGPYESFRSGGYNRYLGAGQWVRCLGSPLSNGQFQFDLWAEEAQLLSDNDDLNEEVYNRDDDVPIEPTQWGQLPTQIQCQDLNGTMVSFIVEPCWDSLRPYIMKYGVRHSLLIALMPTATTAQLFSNAESTEAHQAVLYTRSVNHGNFTIVIPRMIRDLKAIGLWTEKLTEFIKVCGGSIKYIHHYINDRPEEFPEADFRTPYGGDGHQILSPDAADRLAYIQRKYQTMYEMSQKIPIRHARQRGIYVCQSQSLNIYAKDATQEQLKAIHSYTNAMGLKTGMYYLRMDPATFTGKFTVDPLMLQYVQQLMVRIGVMNAVRASSVQEALTEDAVCEMTPGCVSCQ